MSAVDVAGLKSGLAYALFMMLFNRVLHRSQAPHYNDWSCRSSTFSSIFARLILGSRQMFRLRSFISD